MKLASSTARMGAIVFLCLLSMPAEARRHRDNGHEGGGCMPSSLRHTLAEVSRRFGHVEVISAHRPGATIAGSGRRSYHADCRAVDFNPPSGKYSQVAAWLKANHHGGVGTYSCGMHHIHIDNGPNVRFHKCQGSDGGHRHASRHGKRTRHAASHSRGSRHAGRHGSRKRYAGL